MKQMKILCNMCGKELNRDDRLEGLSITRQMGYGSKYDGEEIDFDLCCNCFDNLIDSMKINPITNEMK